MRAQALFTNGTLRSVLGRLRSRRRARYKTVLRQQSAMVTGRPSKVPTRFHRSTDNDLEMMQLWSSTISA